MADSSGSGGQPERTSSGGWVPVPDPTTLTTEAVARATEVFRREIEALHDLHDRDLAAFRELLDARLDGMDNDRRRLWDRSEDLIKRFTNALEDFRDEVGRRDEAGRQLIEQRLQDLDKARILAAEQIKDIPVASREARERLCHDFHGSLAAEREYHLAKLEVLTTRTEERFKAVDKGFAASKEAVAAALQAAKEAVSEQNRANASAIGKSEAATKEQLTSLSQVSVANFRAQEDKITDTRDRLTAMESLTRGIEEAGGESREERGLAHSTAIAIIASVSVLIAIASVIFAAVHG